jgi:hypothetical protein
MLIEPPHRLGRAKPPRDLDVECAGDIGALEHVPRALLVYG